MRKLCVLLGLLLCGCATTTYHGPGAQQALNDCEVQADMLPVTQQALTNPFFVAAYQEDFVDRCMRAKGYQAN